MSESKFRHNKVDPFLKSLENTAEFSIQQTSIRGDPDKILCAYGFFVWLELKDEDGKADKLQKYKASIVTSKGKGIAITARPQNWDMVKHFLSQLDAGILDRSALKEIKKGEKEYD